MSAIFGIWNKTGIPVDEKHLQKMQNKVIQYGRDDQDIYYDQNIGFGCCLNNWSKYAKEDEPVYFDQQEGFFLICDAVIYNREELIEKCSLTDSGDDPLGSETISTQALLAAAYKKWGADCAKYINGDFAFVVWEKEKKKLLVFRDHLGVRPLYYYDSESAFAFSTDYRALLALPFVDKQVDEVMLYAKLSNTYHIDTECTFFEQIKRLPQAHMMVVDEQNVRKKKYWSPGTDSKLIYNTEEEYTQALYNIVDDAIKLRVNGVSGKLGAELSGGLDSSVITILASRELKKTDKKLEELFSWSPPYEILDKQPRDERDLIEAVCRQEKLNCTYYDPRNLPERENPANPSQPLEAAYSRDVLHREFVAMSSKRIRCVLSGWGGDEGVSHRTGLYELFMEGYTGYFLNQVLWRAKGSPLRFIKIIIANTLMQWFRPYSYFGSPNKGVQDILNNAFAKNSKRKCKKDILYSNVHPVKHLESGAVQERTELAARLGAGYNVQPLYPFLDYRVVDFAMSVPRYMYNKQGVNRYIYRKAFAGILPRQFDDYFTKNDAAKTAYYRKRAAENPEKLKKAADMLDRNLFSRYIDWDKLQKAVKGAQPNDDSGKYSIIKNKIQACLDIQQALEEMNGNYW